MSESQEKLPEPQSQMVRRPDTVDSLFVDSMLGGKNDAPHSVSSQIGQKQSLEWHSIFEKTDKELEKQVNNSSDSRKKAQAEVARQQLKDLNDMPAFERNDLLQNLRSNDQKLDGLKQAAGNVHEALFTAQIPSAIDMQTKVVKLADALDQKALQSEAGSIKKVMQQEDNPEVRSAMNEMLDATLNNMASPFVERARLGAIHQRVHHDYQGEQALSEAAQSAKSAIPGEAWQLPANRDLAANVNDVLSNLHVQNSLLELWDKNAGQFAKISGRKDIRRDELSTAKTSDPEFGALTRFLSTNYEALTSKHSWLLPRHGITRDDIQRYVDDHNRTVNDLDFRKR